MGRSFSPIIVASIVNLSMIIEFAIESLVETDIRIINKHVFLTYIAIMLIFISAMYGSTEVAFNKLNSDQQTSSWKRYITIHRIFAALVGFINFITFFVILYGVQGQISSSALSVAATDETADCNPAVDGRLAIAPLLLNNARRPLHPANAIPANSALGGVKMVEVDNDGNVHPIPDCNAVAAAAAAGILADNFNIPYTKMGINLVPDLFGNAGHFHGKKARILCILIMIMNLGYYAFMIHISTKLDF